jgi:glycosyltransferase involved in cell wall biosynthesis
LKIILVGTAHPFRGGLASFNERLMSQFQQEGHEVMILNFTLQYPSFLFPGKTQYSDSPAPENLKIIRRVNAINPLSWIKNGLFLLAQKPDILLFKYWLPFMAPCFGVISMFAGFRKSIRRIAILDNIIPHEKRFLDSLLTFFFVWQIDGFLAMSRSVASDLKNFTTNKKCILSPHPLFDNFGPPKDRQNARKYFGLNAHHRVLLFFGFIRPYKGLDLLLEALATLEMDGIKLIIAGEFYTDEKPYFEMAERLGIKDQLIWKNQFISNEEVGIYFCAADLVVQPYRHATQSGVTQIAYHFEKPMLVTNVGGLAEMVPEGISGYLVSPDPTEIAEKIAYFFENPEQSEMLKRGLLQEKKKYLWSVMTKNLMHLAQLDNDDGSL